MHVIHAVNGMVTEPDREDSDKVSPVAQKKFRLDGVNSSKELGKDFDDSLFSPEGNRNDRAAEYDAIRHMDLVPST
ncbi:hypothetical protein SB778_30475 [Paraburkholderia sp. SIMBA_050]